MNRIKYIVIFFLITLTLVTVYVLGTKRPSPRALNTPAKQLSWFEFSPQRALTTSDTYAYHALLNFKINNSSRELINNEEITIRALHGQLHLVKKIDEAHFFEILENNNQLVVKNRNGEWRSGSSNKAQYKTLIDESFNSLRWLIEQADLQKILVKNRTGWEISNKPLPPDAPLRALIPITLSNTLVNAQLEQDPHLAILRRGVVNITLSGHDDFTLVVTLTLNFATTNKEPMPPMPEVHEELLTVPVNIATRFKHLMDAR